MEYLFLTMNLKKIDVFFVEFTRKMQKIEEILKKGLIFVKNEL